MGSINALGISVFRDERVVRVNVTKSRGNNSTVVVVEFRDGSHTRAEKKTLVREDVSSSPNPQTLI